MIPPPWVYHGLNLLSIFPGEVQSIHQNAVRSGISHTLMTLCAIKKAAKRSNKVLRRGNSAYHHAKAAGKTTLLYEMQFYIQLQ